MNPMENTLLVAIGISVFIAALIGKSSGVTTAIIEIFAGIALSAIFNLAWPEILTILAELGVVSLMFIAGLEMDLQFLREKGSIGVRIGAVAFIIPFAVLLVLLHLVAGLDWNIAILFAIGLSECSGAIVYPVLLRKGELGERRRIVLSAAIIMEGLGIILFTLLFADISAALVGLIAFVVIIPFVWEWLRSRYTIVKATSVDALSLKFILTILLTATFLAHSSGIDAIAVGFILGMIFARTIKQGSALQTQIEAVSYGFLTPIFFLSIGYSISIPLILKTSGAIIALSVITLIITYISIYITTKHYLPKRARVVSILLNSPLIVGSITATVGLKNGILTEELYTVLVGTVIVSSLIAVLFGRYPDDAVAAS